MVISQDNHDFIEPLITEHRNPLALSQWLEGQSEISELQKIALNPDAPLKLPRPRLWKRALSFLKHIVWTDHTNLYGKNYTTPEMLAEAKTTARLISIADLINIITTYPLLWYVCSGLGVAGGVLSGVMALLINNYSSALGESACRGRIKASSWVSLGGFFLINLLLSLTAAPGMELMLNQTELAVIKSRELIDEKVFNPSREEDRKKRLDDLRDIADEAQETCSLEKAKLAAIEPGEPGYDAQFLLTHGPYNSDAERIKLDEKDLSIPACPNAKSKRQEVDDYETKIVNEKDVKQEARNNSGSDTLYLKNNHPEIYTEHFNDNGHVSSGLDASRIAIENFTGKLSSGALTSLGFPFFFFALSLVTSGFTVAKVGVFSRRDDVLLSWEPEAYELREAMYDEVLQGLHTLYGQNPPSDPDIIELNDWN